VPRELGQEVREFVEANPSVKKLFEEKVKKSKDTAIQYSYLLHMYWIWLKDKGYGNMGELLEEHKRLRKEDGEYKHNDLLKEYLLNGTMALKSLSHRSQMCSAIRALYGVNRVPLPQEKIDLAVTKVDRQKVREKLALKEMTLKDFEALITPMKVREKDMLIIMVESGMGIGEFTSQFNVCTCREEWLKNGNGHVCEPAKVMRQLRENNFPIKIELVGRKSNPRPYHTYIGTDGIEYLKRYLNFRKALIKNAINKLKNYEEKLGRGCQLSNTERRHMNSLKERLPHLTPEWSPGEPIFITNHLNPVQEQSIQIPVKQYKRLTGLQDRVFTPHTCRDLFKTECSHVGVPDIISEFWIGHSLDAYGYNRLDKIHPEDFIVEYKKVEPELNVVSHAGSEISLEEVEKLRDENTTLKERLLMVEAVVKQLTKAVKPELDVEQMLRESGKEKLDEATGEAKPIPKSSLRLSNSR